MHPILLFPGHWYTLYSYGFMLLLAMVCAMLLLQVRAPRFGLTASDALDFSLVCIVCGLLGARVLEILWEWPRYYAEPELIFSVRQGLSFQGSVMGGFVGFLGFCAYTGRARAVIADMATPSLIVGHILGRFGCFLGGCCYGRATNVPWAVVYPEPALHFLRRHPTQLYEAFCEMAVLTLLLCVERRLKTGMMFYVYVCLYSIERFIIDFYREEPILWHHLDLAQLISIATLVVGIGGVIWALRQPATSVSVVGHDAENDAEHVQTAQNESDRRPWQAQVGLDESGEGQGGGAEQRPAEQADQHLAARFPEHLTE
jgi:phosphatidylglycerol:prolipoprotein diacylglycerol transferase